jgi:hypothetical protein
MSEVLPAPNHTPPRSAFSTGCGIGCGIIAAFAALAAVVLLVGGASCVGCLAIVASGTPRLRVACEAGGDDGDTCSFTNSGTGSGTMCVRVAFRHRRSGEVVTSEETCSGSVAAGNTVERPVIFVERRVRDVCSGRRISSSCDMAIIQSPASGTRVALRGACELRAWPDDDAEQVGQADAHVRYEVLGLSESWRRIRVADGTEGWVGCASE